MAGYTKVTRAIWQSDDFRSLTIGQQWLYQLLMTQPDLSQCGVLPITAGRWSVLAKDADAAAIRADLDVLAATNYVVMDPRTEELFVRSFIRYDEGYRVPNIRIALIKSCESIISKKLRTHAAATLAYWFEHVRETAKDGKNEEATTLPGTLTGTLDRTLWQSLQPATCNLQPTPAAANVSETGQADPPADPAAAALELFITHRTRQVSPANPGGFAADLRRKEPTKRAPKLATYLAANPDATAVEIAENVYDLGPIDLIALGHTPTRNAP